MFVFYAILCGNVLLENQICVCGVFTHVVCTAPRLNKLDLRIGKSAVAEINFGGFRTVPKLPCDQTVIFVSYTYESVLVVDDPRTVEESVNVLKALAVVSPGICVVFCDNFTINQENGVGVGGIIIDVSALYKSKDNGSCTVVILMEGRYNYKREITDLSNAGTSPIHCHISRGVVKVGGVRELKSVLKIIGVFGYYFETCLTESMDGTVFHNSRIGVSFVPSVSINV